MKKTWEDNDAEHLEYLAMMRKGGGRICLCRTPIDDQIIKARIRKLSAAADINVDEAIAERLSKKRLSDEGTIWERIMGDYRHLWVGA